MGKKDEKLMSDEKNIIEKLEAEKQDLENRLKRALADYQNLNKNVISEKAEFARYALEGFFLELLPVYENLKMSISTLNENDSNNPWVEGIKYVIKQLQEIVKECKDNNINTNDFHSKNIGQRDGHLIFFDVGAQKII